jgi:serine/threonine-protein kinase
MKTMLGKILVSRYKICEELGRGGFGQTFIAEDIHLPGHPKCVIKQLKPKDTRSFVLESARKLFDREAQTLYKLGKHSQIPALLAHFEEENEFYLAQEMIEGVVLSQEIIPGKKLSDSFTFWLLEEVLQTLEFVQALLHE